MESRFQVFLPAARPPAAAGSTASAARVSMAIWRGRTRLPNRASDLTARGVGGAGGPPVNPPPRGGGMWGRLGANRPKEFSGKETIHERSGSRSFSCFPRFEKRRGWEEV